MTRGPGPHRPRVASAAKTLAVAGHAVATVTAATAATAVAVFTGVAAVAVIVATLAAVTVAVAPPAHAATAYRYWAFYVAAGDSWNYSQRGPAFEHPADGEVQGWRFAAQSPGSQDLLPRYRPDFAILCANTPAQQGQLRVGVVIDFGVPADAPPGQQPPSQVFTGCVRVPDGSTGMDVLNAAVGAGNVRIGTGRYVGLVCGISGYPKAECAAAAAAAATATPATAVTTEPAAPAPTAQTSTIRTPATPSQAVAAPATSATSGAAQRAATTAGATPALTPPLSSAAPAPASAATTTSGLADLRRHESGGGFPIGAVIGGGLVVLLGAAAAWRIWVARR